VDPRHRLPAAAHATSEAEEKLPKDVADEAAATTQDDSGPDPDVADTIRFRNF
jgi:hypothetical protein